MTEDLLDQRYELIEQVGSGGMATVYRGRDRRLGGREVAVKLLHPHLAQRSESRRRFALEAEAAAGLEHDNILKVFDASAADSDSSYIVMEFVHGRTLAAVVDDRPIRVPEVGVMIAHEVARGVAHAHRARILHRDIKPENVMLREDGAVKLTDFGIARALDTTHLTTTGALMGSPAHMAPEHIEGRPLDFRADVFSLGILLYYCVTGVLPFTAPSPHALLRKILEGEFESAQRVRPAVGRRLSRIIDRAMAREPDGRHSSVEELLSELSAYLRDFGLTDATRELREWNRDPESYEERLGGRVVERLHELAAQALARGRRAEALEHLDRILSLRENDERAAQLLARLTARRERSTWMFAIGGVAAVALAAAIAWSVWGGSPVPGVTETLAAAVAPGATGLTVPERLSVEPPRRERLPRRDPEVTVEALGRRELAALPPTLALAPVVGTVRPPIRPDREQLHKVVIKVAPPAVIVTVDGRRLGGPTPYRLELPAGTHKVVLEHPTCDVCERTERTLVIQPGKDPPEQSYRIKLKPASLTVHTNTPSTVWEGSKSLGRSGQTIVWHVEDLQGERLKLRVEAPGYQEAVRPVQLKPGEQKVVDVHLEPVALP